MSDISLFAMPGSSEGTLNYSKKAQPDSSHERGFIIDFEITPTDGVEINPTLPADVVLVFDISDQMDPINDPDQGSLWTQLQETANTIVDSINPSEDGTHVGIVVYGGSGNPLADPWSDHKIILDFSGDSEVIKGTYRNRTQNQMRVLPEILRTGMGTWDLMTRYSNYSAGFQGAKDLFETSGQVRSDAKKYIIFISGAEMNCYYTTGISTLVTASPQGVAETLQIANDLKAQFTNGDPYDLEFYTLGLSEGGASLTQTMIDLLNPTGINQYQTEFLENPTEATLISTLEHIGATTSTPLGFSNINITDPMGLYNGSPIVSIYDRNQDGLVNAKDVEVIIDQITNIVYSNNDRVVTYSYTSSDGSTKELLVEVKPDTSIVGQYTIVLEHPAPLDDGKSYILNYVVELSPDFEDGVDYSANEDAVITYDYDGVSGIEIPVESPIINNTPLNYSIPGNKLIPAHVVGFSQFPGFFEFGLYLDSTATPIAVATNNASGNFSFPVSLYRERTYTFYIKEMPQQTQDNGWTIDPNPIKVEVYVRQLNKNYYVRDKTIFYRWDETTQGYIEDLTLTKAVFTNEYEHVRNAKITFNGLKKVEGNVMPTEPFTFGIFEGASQTPIQTVQNNPTTGIFEFLPIEIDEAKNHTYSIKEVTPSQYGWISDTTTHLYNIRVRDDYQGTLLVEVVGRTDITPGNEVTIGGNEFTNVYQISPVDVSIEATKVCPGWVNSLPSFEFHLSSLSGQTPVSNVTSKGGSINFETTFDQPGIYRYEMSELPANLKGWILDTSKYEVEVDIKVNASGALYPDKITYFDSSQNPLIDLPQFENTFDISTFNVVIPGKKIVNTSNYPENYFFFEIIDSDEKQIDTATIDENGNFTLTIENIHQVGNFTYIVREMTASGNGWTKDSRVYPILVTVTQNNGNLEVNWSSQLGDIIFENIYATGPHTPDIHAHKTWLGWDKAAAGFVEKFEFFLIDKGGNTIATATNDDEGLVEFNLEFSDFKDAGDYVFEIRENQESVTSKPGWRLNEDKSYQVDVTLIDEKGELKSQVSYPNGLPVFENTYQAQPREAISFNGIVRTEGAALETEFFHIGIFDENGNELASTKNNSIGDYHLPDLEFTKPGEYVRIIRQINPQTEMTTDDWNGWKYDTTQYEITIKVEDNFKGVLEWAITNIQVMEVVDGVLVPKVVADKNRLDFVNRYNTIPLDKIIAGKKVLNGQNEGELPKFEFQLIDTGQGDTGLTYKDFKYDEESGMITFNLTYKMPGTYHYMMREVQTPQLGWTLDHRQWPIVAHVTDNGEGHLACQLEYPEGVPIFINTYTKPEIKLEDFGFNLSAHIILANWYGCREFPVILADSDTGQVIVEACSVNGYVDLSGLSFTKPGVYTYMIYQPCQEYCNWELDEKVYQVQVTVSEIVLEDGTGWLTLAVEYLNGKPCFINEYTGKEECVKIKLDIRSEIKEIDKNTLTAGNLIFTITGGTGQVYATANLRKKRIYGSFVEGKFSEICYTKPGVYHYTMWQTAAYPSNWNFCHRKYSVVVTVSARPTGKLIANIEYPNGAPEFENWFVIK